MDRQPIYIAAYPKSGSTWLTRLLADVLNSPSGGCMHSEDAKEIATEGQDRPGPYIIRKGHFVLIDDDTGSVVPRPHRLAWKRLTDEKIVFLVRDPRDICISGAWHWNKSTSQEAVEQFLDRMIKGDVARCGRWDEYCRSFYDTMGTSYHLTFGDIISTVKYEHIISNPLANLKRIIYNELKLRALNENDAIVSIVRQSFSTRKTKIGNNPKELRRNNMRKGTAGDWRNHFTPAMNDKIWQEFGWMMERLGYDRRSKF